MSGDKIRSPVGYCKVGIVVLSIIVMGVGLHSHFQSSWKKHKVYSVCKNYMGNSGFKCPSISMEQYYVAMVIIFFILSILVLAATLLLDLDSDTFRLGEVAYHGIAAFMLLIGAIVYFVSANQINKFGFYGPGTNMRHDEKIAAGVLTIFQVILYGITAALLFLKR